MPQSEAWKDLPKAMPFRNCLAGDGRLAQKTRDFDWAATPLGASETWPTSLKSAVQIMLASKHAICLFWGPELNMLYNDAYAPFLGTKEPDALGKPFQVVWADVWDDILPLARSALSGEGIRMEDLPLLMTRNGYEEETWWTFSYSPLYDDEGNVAGLINIATETTKAFEAKRDINSDYADAKRLIAAKDRAERQQRVLQREMAHRIKNTLSMVMAIVSQSMRHASSMEDASIAIGDRVGALGKAQDLLRQSTYISADIREVVDGALRPHLDDSSRVVVAGPDVALPAQQALGLSLAIHELATNAAKYGALSNATGHVTLGWEHDATGAFHLEWQEHGGPAVSKPMRKGFGSRLTNQIVASYFDGEGRTTFDTEGLRFVLSGTVPQHLDDTVEPSDRPPVGNHEQPRVG